jgi:hypothetical protein
MSNGKGSDDLSSIYSEGSNASQNAESPGAGASCRNEKLNRENQRSVSYNDTWQRREKRRGENMKIFTIGFTKKTARTFFTKLRQSGADRIVDIRLNNVSQLAGFTKKDDLEFFLKEICGMDYTYVTELAPTQGIMDEFKKNKGDWSTFEK